MNNKKKKHWDWGGIVLILMLSLGFIDIKNGKFQFHFVAFLFVLVMLALLSLAGVAFIIMLDRRKQNKYLPNLSHSRLDYCAFPYSSLNLLEEKLISDGFYQKPISESNYIINWFCKITNKKSKLNYRWLETESIIFANFTESMNIKLLLGEIDKANKFKKNKQFCAEYAIICITGDDIPRKFILQSLKNSHYTYSPVFTTIAIDLKNNKVYKANIPNRGITKVLYNLAISYFI